MTSTNLTTTLLLLTVLLVVLPSGTYAFGAGDIPDFAYLNDKAFRHGDIENILSELVKSYGHSSGDGGILGLASSLITAATGGAKFNKDDVKKVYFGNWLRDYSQAMDIAGLSKLTGDTIVLIVSVLGFLTFGFATEEFEVTADRLGVYLPVEHIDNPKGYAEKEGDARQFHPKLRPPVRAEELEIDARTGMKNYMATENRGWDTSTAHVRRVFRACIEHGRRARGREGGDLWEAYRLLGTGLHTMEDLLAHSNWCEIALRKMGHSRVFCHVGDRVIVNTPNGSAPPLVTGTFGSADFMHSMMGEATDHLSQASVVDLSAKMSAASSGDNSFIDLKNLLSKIPLGGGGDDSLNQMNQMHEESKAYDFDPSSIATPEVQKKLLQLLVMRDNIYRQVLKKIEQIPGLSELLEALTNALNAYIYTILAPYLTPILQQVSSVLSEGSQAIIATDDQYEVFNNPNASDPSHSLLSKDHFALVLNEPAGKIALVVVRYTVSLIVQAWHEDVNPDKVIDQVLEAFHHPYYATGRSRIQNDMFQEMQRWVEGLEDQQTTLGQLSKENVRAGRNKRQGSDDDMTQSNQVYGGSVAIGNYGTASRPSYAHSPQTSGVYGGSYGGQGRYDAETEETGTSGGYDYDPARPNYDRIEDTRTSGQQTYGRTQNAYESSGGDHRQQQGSVNHGFSRPEGYGSSQDVYRASRVEEYNTGRQESTYISQDAFSRPDRVYGQQSSAYGYSRDDDSGAGRRHGEADTFYNQSGVEESFGRMSVNENSGYGGGHGYSDTDNAYSVKRWDDDDIPKMKDHGYSSSRKDEDDNEDGHKKKAHGYSSSKRDDYKDHSHNKKDSENSSRWDGDESSYKKKKDQEDSYGRTEGYGGSYAYGNESQGSDRYGGSSRYGGSGGYGVSGGYGGGEIVGGYGSRIGSGDQRHHGEGGKHHRKDSKEKKHKDKPHNSSDESEDGGKRYKKEKHHYGRESSEERGQFKEHKHGNREHNHRRKDSD